MSIDYKNNAEYNRQEAKAEQALKQDIDKAVDELYFKLIELRDEITDTLDDYFPGVEEDDLFILSSISEEITHYLPETAFADYRKRRTK